MNENYFEIPTVENCYFAGLIATDGCISDTCHGQNRLSVGLVDKEVLENLHKKLLLTNSLSFTKSKERSFKNKICLTKPIYRLRCSSNKICSDLKRNWNITPRKSYTLKPPNIEEINLIKSFLIGVIDGDGSIFWSKTHKCFVLSICGNSEEFLVWCKERLAYIGKIKESPKLYNDKNTFSLQYWSNKANSILNELKDVNVPRLNRKWEKISY